MLRSLVARLLLAALLLPVAAFAQDGTLDPTFGDGGRLSLTPAPESGALAVAPLANGDLLLGGRVGHDAAVLRLDPDGTLDPDFGDDGIVAVDHGGDSDVFTDLAVLDDGNVLLSGARATDDTAEIGVVARLLPDGTLDAGFGAGGLVYFDATLIEGLESSQFLDLRALPSGSSLVAGTAFFDGAEVSEAVVVRFTPSGTLDAAFGEGGFARPAPAGNAALGTAVGVLPDGSVVATGSTFSSAFEADAFVARLTPSGAFDPDFGDGGVRVLDLGGALDVPGDVVIEDHSDGAGRIVVVGSALDLFAGASSLVVARLLDDGALDEGFGDGGRVTSTFGAAVAQGAAGVLQPDGKLVVTGPAGTATAADFLVARLQPDGTLDDGFGSGGTTTVSFSDLDLSTAVALQADGRIVVAGYRSDGGGMGAGDAIAIEIARLRNDMTTEAEGTPAVGPATLALAAPYPNPTRGGHTTIALNLAEPSRVRVEVLDALGRRVALLHEGPLAAGEHRLTLDVNGLPAGVYVVRATGGGLDLTRRVTLVR